MAKTKITVLPINSYTTLSGTQSNNVLYAPATDPLNRLVVVDGLGGNDTIYANSAGGGMLFGNAGDDKIFGNIGNDVLLGGTGNDYMDGGAGIDQVSYLYDTAAVTVDLTITTAQSTGGAGTDTIINVEQLAGTAFNDTLLGNGSDNVISGNDGNDIIDGRAGGDVLFGGKGDDTLYGGDGNDTLLGQGGNDTVYGGAGDDLINGGNWYSVRIRDTGPNNDYIDGGTGTDKVYYNMAYGPVNVNLSSGVATGGAGINAFTQTLLNIENVDATSGNDTLIGSDADNVLFGDYGDDILVGNGGNDRLLGSAGSDQMTGGSGADTFVMDLMRAGKDLVLDFSAAEGDKIDISSFTNYATTYWHATGAHFLDNGAAFTGVAGEIHVITDAATLGLQHIEMDYNGDMTADMFGDAYSTTTLSSGDFFFYA